MKKTLMKKTLRYVLKQFAIFLIGLNLLQVPSVRAADAVPFRWQTTHDIARRLEESQVFQEKPKQEIPTGNLKLKSPSLVILIGVALLPSIVKGIIVAYRNLRYGGIVINMKDKELIIRNDRNIPYGTVLVIDKNISIYKVDDIPDSGSLITALTELTKHR